MNSSITESVGLATLPSQGPFLCMSGPLASVWVCQERRLANNCVRMLERVSNDCVCICVSVCVYVCVFVWWAYVGCVGHSTCHQCVSRFQRVCFCIVIQQTLTKNGEITPEPTNQSEAAIPVAPPVGSPRSYRCRISQLKWKMIIQILMESVFMYAGVSETWRHCLISPSVAAQSLGQTQKAERGGWQRRRRTEGRRERGEEQDMSIRLGVSRRR